MGVSNIVALPQPAPFLNTRFDLTAIGYCADEYLFSGQAFAFQKESKHGALSVSDRAQFCTRLLVFRPQDLSRFSGVVAVEWLNVTGGFDLAPDWVRLHRHLVREGAIWVGVSVQRIGVEGGSLNAGYGLPLKQANPDRYGEAHHPGDQYAYDIFSQAGRVIRSGALSFPPPKCILGTGSSQSARFLTTYVSEVDADAQCFDGFLITGRSRSAATLAGAPNCGGVVHFQADLRAPVFVLQPESDPFGRMQSHKVRQENNAHFRLWEVAGAAHGDSYLVSAGPIDDGLRDIRSLASAYNPARVNWVKPQKPVNACPGYHYVASAAFSHLAKWAQGLSVPPMAPLLEGDPKSWVRRDEFGIAIGGVRTPWVDAPALIYSGENGEAGDMESLFGQTEALSPQQLRHLYPGGVRKYMSAFEAALERAISSGVMLAADAPENLALAGALFPETA